MPRATRLACALFFFFCLLALTSATLSSAPAAIAIVGARLIDGTGAPPLDNAVVVVEGDRIRAAGPRGAVSACSDAVIS